MSKIKIYWAVIKGWLTPGTSAFEEVVAYALNVLNTFISTPNVSTKVAKAYETVVKVLSVLNRFADWCPQKWREDFDKIRTIVEKVAMAFADGKVTKDELDSVVDLFRIEYAKWFAD